jgi:F-type H+-transporting ATPase subunit gamma
MQANPEYTHPYLVERTELKAVGIVVVSTDKGLCGGLNTNIMRLVLARTREFNDKNIRTQFTAFGNKSLGVLTRMRAEVVSQAVGLGDKPELDRLIGAVKVQLDDFLAGRIDAVYIATNRFVNTMKQEPTFVRLLPLPGKLADPYNLASATAVVNSESETAEHGWDYIYEPDAQTVIDELLQRYVEGLVYQGVAESMASEQSARMVAMKAASDNAKKVIGDLQLVFNKTRQAAITKEISEIVGGAAAV